MMLKKAFGLAFSLLVSCNYAYANYTEDLQNRFANSSMYVEYVESDFVMLEKIVPSSNILKNDTKVQEFKIMELDKFVFARNTDGRQYYRHDYALAKINEKDASIENIELGNQRLALKGSALYILGFDYKNVRAYIGNGLNEFELGKIKFKNPRNYSNISTTINNDVNIVSQGKVYAVDREKKTIVYKDTNLLNMEMHGKYLVCNEMVVPNAINTVVLKYGKKNIKFLESYLQNIDGNNYTCEVYIFEDVANLQDNVPYRVKLYYDQHGNLTYFSHIQEEGKISMADEAYGVLKISNPEEFNKSRPRLYKVIKLENTVEESLFELPSGYDLKEAVDK